jgi:dUTP pyrophosphatase
MKIKRLNKEAKIPTYANPKDAGMDLYAVRNYKIKSKDVALIDTGIAIELPRGHAGLIWDNSGLATKYGLKVLGGVVDEGYRGEVKVGLINLSRKTYNIEKGDKVAQILIQKITRIKPKLIKDLSSSRRGGGGFGSSGKK